MGKKISGLESVKRIKEARKAKALEIGEEIEVVLLQAEIEEIEKMIKEEGE